MITVTFLSSDGVVNGFEITGHSDYSQQGSDIVCAAVSSAAYMTVNTVTDIQRINADVAADDGFMSFSLSPGDAGKAADIINGFRLHLTALEEQYKKYIKVKFSEV